MPARGDAGRPARARASLRERPRLPRRRRRVRGRAGARTGPPSLIEETVALGRLALRIERPRDSEALLDEEAFEQEEFLPYWAELWPSSLALARALLRDEPALPGRRVLELGCGLAIPSVVAALLGARVLATDWSPDAVAAATRNAELNGAAVETALVRWDDPAQIVERAPWDLVLAADVLYERRNGEQLLELLPRLVRGSGAVLIAEPGRPAAAAFFEAASRSWSVDREADPESQVPVFRLSP